MNERTYTTQQAAEKLKVSIRRIQALIKTGMLRATKVGRDWVIPAEEVDRFMQTDRRKGRPSKNDEGQATSYVERPSDLYLQVVEMIGMLLDRDGLDTALRAFAEAAAPTIQVQATTGFTPKGRSHVCLHRLLGAERCPDSFEHPCDSPRFPGQDHLSEWVKDGKTAKIISQPYGLSYQDIKEIVEFCEARDLKAEISGESWHFPGRTIRIEFTPRSEGPRLTENL